MFKFLRRNTKPLPNCDLKEFLSLHKEKDYPSYLKELYKNNTGEDLNLDNPKTFGEKIQWLKLYDTHPVKTVLTDKVLVRDWVKEKIGTEYIKKVYWVGKNFDKIPFDTLPDDFYIKMNNGCKWQVQIKDKTKFLNNKQLYSFIKNRFDSYMVSNWFPHSFEPQYKDITPKIFIEETIKNGNKGVIDIEAYCFEGKSKLYKFARYSKPIVADSWNENFEIITNRSGVSRTDEIEWIITHLKTVKELSEVLAKEFKFVRVDWILAANKIYFNEMTFTPCSGFYTIQNAGILNTLAKDIKI